MVSRDPWPVAVAAEQSAVLKPGDKVALSINSARRRTVEAHHTATHLLHWALHEIVSPEATQQGSLVAEDRLRFDFTSSAVSAEQIAGWMGSINYEVPTGIHPSVPRVMVS